MKPILIWIYSRSLVSCLKTSRSFILVVYKHMKMIRNIAETRVFSIITCKHGTCNMHICSTFSSSLSCNEGERRTTFEVEPQPMPEIFQPCRHWFYLFTLKLEGFTKFQSGKRWYKEKQITLTICFAESLSSIILKTAHVRDMGTVWMSVTERKNTAAGGICPDSWLSITELKSNLRPGSGYDIPKWLHDKHELLWFFCDFCSAVSFLLWSQIMLHKTNCIMMSFLLVLSL